MQKKLLDAWHEKTQTDINVASYIVLQKNGEISSYAVWAEGVDTLLPEAEEVVFMRSDKTLIGIAPWTRVLESLGHLMSPDETLPPRYRVNAFPIDRQLNAVVETDL